MRRSQIYSPNVLSAQFCCLHIARWKSLCWHSFLFNNVCFGCCLKYRKKNIHTHIRFGILIFLSWFIFFVIWFSFFFAIICQFIHCYFDWPLMCFYVMCCYVMRFFVDAFFCCGCCPSMIRTQIECTNNILDSIIWTDAHLNAY